MTLQPINNRPAQMVKVRVHSPRGWIGRERIVGSNLSLKDKRLSIDAKKPFRILRDAQTRQSVSTPGLFPLGEGAGYAGGAPHPRRDPAEA
jgi:hypothetical protein